MQANARAQGEEGKGEIDTGAAAICTVSPLKTEATDHQARVLHHKSVISARLPFTP
jgi:hypothetical protein